MSNAVFDTVRTVLAVREFDQRPVAGDVVGRILEAGRLSASSMNKQPWHFVLVREREGLARLGALVRTGPYIAEAAFAVIVAYRRDSRFGVSDASRAIQSMVLTAWGEGVGSNWAGFMGLDGVREWAGIPEGYEVLAVLPFGYPAHQLGRGKKNRLPFGEVVSVERYRASAELS